MDLLSDCWQALYFPLLSESMRYSTDYATDTSISDLGLKLHTQPSAEQHLCAWQGMAFGWEAVMTFVLVAVVYAVAIGKPSFSETGPLAVGFSLWASAIVGKPLNQNCRSNK